MDINFLKRGEVQSLAMGGGDVLRNHSGVLWLTIDGENRDVILRAHQSWTAPHNGKVVLQAVRDSSFHQTPKAKVRAIPMLIWARVWKPSILKL